MVVSFRKADKRVRRHRDMSGWRLAVSDSDALADLDAVVAGAAVAALREWDRARVRARSDEIQEQVQTVQDQPFADVCQSMLRQAFSPGASVVFSDSPDLLALLRTDELRAALLK